MEWREISGGWVYLPSREIKGIIHFLGGAFVATAPQISYRSFLEQVSQEGYGIIATPFLNTFDHLAIAREVLNRFETILERLDKTNSLGKSYVPIYGIGHSMGCKLHLIIGSLFEVQRAGNILISFNNYPVRQAIPFADQLPVNAIFDLEFTPSPTETNQLIAADYRVRRNLLIQFSNDNIDQTKNLNVILQQRFFETTALRTLPGNHLTPLSQNLNWQTGDIFTPLDAIGQWFKQEFSRDLPRLQKEVLFWLNPVSFL
ncbi:MAG TPA: DUF1350 family protein [Xenococcaceae cyanobacterium]